MRFVIFGAGAIGGVIGGRLFEGGHDVTLVARGAHGRALRERGLELVSPEEAKVLPVPAVEQVADAELRSGDVVVLAMKTQDTAAAVVQLVDTGAPSDVRIVCAQNGVENERLVLRHFADVYAMAVMCPATHLDAGRVVVHAAPVSGLLDLGRYPSGVDQGAEDIAAALGSAAFESVPRADIVRWKYRKLLINLVNAPSALCGPVPELRPLVERLQAEGEACLAAAGIDVATVEEDRARRGDRLKIRPIEGMTRLGGSSWQSLARGLGSIETDYLNGEVVLLGRLHGVPTPANELLQRLAREAAVAHRPPGHLTVDEILARLPPT